jgi:FkbM family methyltransferase
MTYSQSSQDTFLLNQYFSTKTNGFYVDIGANNGITASNTKIFEDRGWNGICIEPNPIIFAELEKNRKSKNYQVCISNLDKEVVDFCQIDGYAEMLSGIVELYDERHKQRILNEQKHYGGNRQKIQVKNYKFSELITVPFIDYLSIDTEGSELDVLQSIDYTKTKIHIITVENNYETIEFQNYLRQYNFKYVTKLGADEVYENTF